MIEFAGCGEKPVGEAPDQSLATETQAGLIELFQLAAEAPLQNAGKIADSGHFEFPQGGGATLTYNPTEEFPTSLLVLNIYYALPASFDLQAQRFSIKIDTSPLPGPPVQELLAARKFPDAQLEVFVVNEAARSHRAIGLKRGSLAIDGILEDGQIAQLLLKFTSSPAAGEDLLLGIEGGSAPAQEISLAFVGRAIYNDRLKDQFAQPPKLIDYEIRKIPQEGFRELLQNLAIQIDEALKNYFLRQVMTPAALVFPNGPTPVPLAIVSQALAAPLSEIATWVTLLVRWTVSFPETVLIYDWLAQLWREGGETLGKVIGANAGATANAGAFPVQTEYCDKLHLTHRILSWLNQAALDRNQAEGEALLSLAQEKGLSWAISSIQRALTQGDQVIASHPADFSIRLNQYLSEQLFCPGVIRGVGV